MWGKSKSKKVDIESHTGRTTIISEGTRLHGDILFSGGLLIEGIVRGKIIAEDSSDSVLHISEVGGVDGDIKVPNVVINGKVKGNVFCDGSLELASKAMVHGDVHYNLIEMAMGCQVNGALLNDQKPAAAVDTKGKRSVEAASDNADDNNNVAASVSIKPASG